MLNSSITAHQARLVCLLATALLLWLPCARAVAQAPPSLQGESLFGNFSQLQATCDSAGTSTLDFTASGTASGPYPGTFDETGHVTIGAQTNVNDPGQFLAFNSGSVTTLHVSFTIHSTAGDVPGTKDLTAPVGTTGEGVCATIAGNAGTDGVCQGLFPTSPGTLEATLERADASATYDATLPGSFRDTGRANMSVSDLELSCTGGGDESARRQRDVRFVERRGPTASDVE